MLNQIKNTKVTFLYFFLVFAGYVITLPYAGFRTGVFASLLMVAIIIETGLSVIKSDSKSDFISLINVCVFAYVVINFFSFIWIINIGYPVSVYVEEFSNSVLPIVFYFVAVFINSENKEFGEEKFDAIYKAFLYAFSVFGLICIIMYLWAPQFYCDYLYRIGMISKADFSTCRVRMEGFTGSTCISYLGVAGMLVAAKFVYKAIEQNGFKNRNCILNSLLFFFNLIIVFLANGRAGMVAAILVIVYINCLVFLTFKLADRKYLYIEAGIVAALIIGMCVVVPSVAAKIWARLVSLPGAVGQRSEQWVAAINNMSGKWFGQWFGNGLGANGHKALNIEGAHIVADGGLVKLYCEEGAIGFALFVFILIIIFRAGIHNLKKYFCEIGIVATVLLMSIGSNIIAFQLCVPIVWFAVGVIGSDVKGNGIQENTMEEKR